MRDIRITSKANAENYSWGNNCNGWHLLKHEDISVIYESMPPATSERMHYHMKAHQFFYILRGTASFLVEGQSIYVKATEGIEIRPMEKHQIRNEGNEILEFILISSPSAHGDRSNLE